MAKHQLPPAEYVRQRLRYSPEIGDLTWLRHPDMPDKWNTLWAGRPAMTATSSDGYKSGAILGVSVSAHRVAWAIYYGEWPSGTIDHINHNPSDNRISNLREVSHKENCRNRAIFKTNTSGSAGVYERTDGKVRKWRAIIKVDGKIHHIGTFTEFDAALAARKEAEKMFGFHQNHGRAR